MMRMPSRNVLPACVRSAAAIVGFAAAFGSVQALGQSRPDLDEHAPKRALIVPVRSVATGTMYLALGDQALERGDLAGADAAYRAAWEDPAARERAALALRDLHRTPGFKLEADEAAVARTRRLLGETFERFDTPHFVILSDCSREWTQSRGDLLERTRTQFFRVCERMGLPAVPHRHKLVCVLFNDHRAYQVFARAYDGLEARWVAGYYATLSNRVVFYNDASSPAYESLRDRLQAYERQMREARTKAEEAVRNAQQDLALRLHASADDLDKQIQRERSRLGERAAAHSTAKTIHEAVHLLAFNCGVQLPDRDYPFWLSEGLATAFETHQADEAFGPDRALHVGPRRERFEELRREGRLAPIERLITISEVPQWDADTADAMYGQSYALFSHLYRENPRAIGAYLMALGAEPAGHLTAERQVELFRQAFGDPAEIGRRLARGR